MARGFVDVQDVSLGHLLASENPKAEGRYLLAEGVDHYKEIMEILRKLYPDYPVTTEPGCKLSEEAYIYTLSDEREQKDLGMKFKSIESQLTDLVTSLQEKGWIKSPTDVDQ